MCPLQGVAVRPLANLIILPTVAQRPLVAIPDAGGVEIPGLLWWKKEKKNRQFM